PHPGPANPRKRGRQDGPARPRQVLRLTVPTMGCLPPADHPGPRHPDPGSPPCTCWAASESPPVLAHRAPRLQQALRGRFAREGEEEAAMTPATAVGYIEMRIAKVVGLAADDELFDYVVLDEVAGDRHLAIEIGQPEAFSLAA